MSNDQREVVVTLVPSPLVKHFDEFVDDLDGADEGGYLDIFRQLEPKVAATIEAAIVHWLSTENKDELPEWASIRRAGAQADDEIMINILTALGHDTDQLAVDRLEVDIEADRQDVLMRGAFGRQVEPDLDPADPG